jgi:hypothetical protein
VVAVSGFAAAAVMVVEMDGGVGVAAGGGGGAQTPAPAPPRRWRLADERCDLRAMETDYVRRFHRHEPRDHQCSSAVAKHIKAPVHLVSACLSLSISSFHSTPLNQIYQSLAYCLLCYAFSPRRRAVSTFPWREYVGCCVALAQSIRRRDIVSIGFSISPFVWPGPAARRPRFWSADARLLD